MELLAVPMDVSLKVWTRKCLKFYGICDFWKKKMDEKNLSLWCVADFSATLETPK